MIDLLRMASRGGLLDLSMEHILCETVKDVALRMHWVSIECIEVTYRIFYYKVHLLIDELID